MHRGWGFQFSLLRACRFHLPPHSSCISPSFCSPLCLAIYPARDLGPPSRLLTSETSFASPHHRRINVSLPKNDNEYTSPSLDAAPASITNRDDRSMHKTHGAAACVAQCTRRSTPRRDGAAASAAAEATPLTPAGSTARANPCRVYVGNVKYSITEAEIGVLFACFGAVKSFNLVVSTAAMHANAHARAVTRGAEAVPHRGYGFVEYFTPKSAKSAVAAMNNLKLAGRPLKVGYAAPLNDPIKSAAAAVSQKISCNLRRATYHAHSVMSKDAVWNIIASRSSALRALSSCLRKSSACRG